MEREFDEGVIERICEAYLANWNQESINNIEDYVRQADSERWRELRAKLLGLDNRRRAELGLTIDLPPNRAYSEESHADLSESPKPTDTTEAYDYLPRTNAGAKASILSQTKKREIIGPYKLLEKIGEGGMGSVWLAEQEQPVRRRVALKLIRADLGSGDTIARFEAERQALAMMDHQNIAKVLDAGTREDGSPYFVMELVKGIPFTDYCDRNKLNVDERLRLFIPVCNAVQHAHQKGIIHRDLKPSNVLVTLYDGKPVPKVIDFGLAKATEHTTKLTDKTMFTEFGKVVGTLQYMAPEQAEMNALDVDTRTDVYALGAMLYETLTGSTPLDRETLGKHALLQILTIILEKEPPPPSARLSSSGEAITGISNQRKIAPHKLRQILRGELDWIVMKALEKDRTRRYDSASALATDIERFLNNDIVVARPPSSAYRLKKQFSQLRRNPLAASIVGIVLAICILVPVSFVWVSHNARVIKQTAEANRLIELLQDENTAKVDMTIVALKPYWDKVAPQVDVLKQSANPKTRLHAKLAQARYDVADTEYLKERLLLGHWDEVPLVAQALVKAEPSFKDELWNMVAQVETTASEKRQQLLGAAAFLAKFDSKNDKWNGVANPLANAIITSRSSEELSAWQHVFEPISSSLTEGLLAAFDQCLKNKESVLATRAVELLAAYNSDNKLLTVLLTRCDPQAYEIVFDRLSTNPLEAKLALQEILRDTPRQQRLRQRRGVNTSSISADVQAELQSAQGFATANFAYCQTLPADKFGVLNEKLEHAGYRLQKLRPYPVKLDLKIAAVWHPSDTAVVYSLNETKKEIQRKHAEYSDKGFKAIDVSGYDSGKERFSAVWIASDFEHTDIHLGLREAEVGVLWEKYSTYMKSVHAYQRRPPNVEILPTLDYSRYSVIVSSFEGEAIGWNRPLYQLRSISRAKHLLDVSFCSTRLPKDHMKSSATTREPLIRFNRLTNPKDIETREQAWQVEFELSDFEAVRDDLTVIINYHRTKLNTETSRTVDGHLGHRAIASAYLGDEQSTNADLAEMTEGWWKHFFAGYTQAILKKFDRVTEEVEILLTYDMAGYERFNAALVYAAAASFASSDNPELSRNFREQALNELSRCSWVDLPVVLPKEILAKPLRELHGFDDFVSKRGLDHNCCFIESYNPVTESECVLNFNPQDSMHQHSKLSRDGYWPASVTCHTIDDRVVSYSVWHRERIRQDELEAWSLRQMRAMVALIRLGFTVDILPYLDLEGDSRLRTRFVHEARVYGISSPDWVLPLLTKEDFPPRQAIALIQYLGLYEPSEIAPKLIQQISERVNELVNHPHPGIHGSAIWLQRTWQIALPNALPLRAAATSSTYPSWIQHQNFGEMIVLPPGSYQAGSIAADDPDVFTSQSREEVKLVSIPHQFALSTYPVTVAQYDRFLDELRNQRDSISTELQLWLDEQENRRRFTRGIVRTSDSPVTKVGIDGVYGFCNWLSKHAGIPEEQWCYATKPLSSELTPVEDQTSLTGFRLPTSAEWEYACRAGSSTRRYYGYSDQFIGNYAWFIDNSDDHVWPVGLKKPNDWGFFDMYGNVWQVCVDQVSRGSDYDGPSHLMRSSFSGEGPNAVNHEGTGFRVARTLLSRNTQGK